jgi:alpha-D-xyloside xylohydrolase
VFSEDGKVSYYVPSGRWTNLLTGAVVEGPGWREETHPYSSLPLLVRPNTVLPVGADVARADYDFRRGVTLRAYSIRDGARVTVTVPGPDGGSGSTFELRRKGAEVTMTAHAAEPGWRLLLVGETVEPLNGCAVEATEEGSLAAPAAPDGSVVVNLHRR